MAKSPNYYQLLRLRLYESNRGVISRAAAKRIADLQAGQPAGYSRKAISRIEIAERCLLDRKAKDKHDANLRLELSKSSSAGERQLVERILEPIHGPGWNFCKRIFGVDLTQARQMGLIAVLVMLSRAVASGRSQRYAVQAVCALCCAAKLIPAKLNVGVQYGPTLGKTLCFALQNTVLLNTVLGAIKQFIEGFTRHGRVPPDQVVRGLARHGVENRGAKTARKCLALIRECGIEGAMAMVPMSKQLLKHANLYIRREVCSILTWLEADVEQVFGLLLETASQDDNAETRFEATQALLKMDPSGTRLADEVKDEVARRRILDQLRQSGVTGRSLRRSLERAWGMPSMPTASTPPITSPSTLPTLPTPAKPAQTGEIGQTDHAAQANRAAQAA